MPRDEGLDWYGGVQPDTGPGGVVDAVGINHQPPSLAVDPDAIEADHRHAVRQAAGPALKVERLEGPSDASTRPRGRVRLRRT